MTSSFREYAVLVLLPFYLYSALLVAGGSGPFVLNRDFWTCHCADSTDPAQESPPLSAKLAGSASPGLDLSDELPVPAGIDICRTDRTPAAQVEDSKVCKRKLPMRYLNAFFGNADTISVATVLVVSRPSPPFSKSLPDAPASIREGIALSLLRPPTRIG